MSAGPADAALDSFKSLVFDPLVKVVITKIIGLASFLAWGPVAFIVTKVVEYIADELYSSLKDTINFQVILFNNEQAHMAYVRAAVDLKSIAKDKGIESPEFRKARDEHRAALSKFVRYSGT